jgi:hypothetical protein
MQRECPAVRVNGIGIELRRRPQASREEKSSCESTHGKISTPEFPSSRLESSACR